MATVETYKSAVEQLLDAIDGATAQVNVTEYDISNPEPDDTDRPANYAESSWRWAINKIVDDLLAAKNKVLKSVGDGIQCAGRTAPRDLIVWRTGRSSRVFPATRAGVNALMDCDTAARYGVPLLFLGVDVRDDVLASMISAGLTVGACEAPEVRDAVAAVAAWRANGSQDFMPE